MDVGPGTRQQTVGVVGLGPLGLVVARRLKGHRPVVAYDASPDARARALAVGLEVLDDHVLLARSGNTVLLAVPAGEVAATVAGLAPYAPGLLLLGLTPLDPAHTRRIAAAALAEGSTYLDVPVLGRAEEVGRWRVPMGGPAAAYDAVVALLAPVVHQVVHVGDVGTASESVAHEA